MGFLELISASNLRAEYDPVTQVLTLSAEGTIQVATSGIEFFRDAHFVGGLKFALEGWVGPLTGATQTYTYDQPIKIHLGGEFNPPSVLILDLNNPNGVHVPIHWLGAKPGPEIPTSKIDKTDKPEHAVKSEHAMTSRSISHAPEDIHLSVLYKEPFTIKQSAEVPKFGTIDIKFDVSFLALQTAGINDGNITWKFNPLRIGNTQVIVTIRGGIANYVRQVKYDIKIQIPLGPGPVIHPTDDADKADKVILSFLGRVNIARRIVEKQYPGAALYNARAYTVDPRGVKSPDQLALLTVIFRDTKANGTITIHSPGGGTFQPSVYDKHPILGNANIQWPVGFDADEADKILKKKGIKDPYTELTLLRSLHPEETYYQFRLVNGRVVHIGVKDGKVTLDGPNDKVE